ncbi:hypothetical protein GCM10009544_07840 [Streptomyces stramineus]|uniref:Mobile element transfer n=1 Tax=Streptomyces stramineus TaxID=173861 RepID=A0ABN0ZHB5_9ACTN
MGGMTRAALLPSSWGADGMADAADLPPGTMKYPACICPQHRAGKGKPDTSVRLTSQKASTPQRGGDLR